MKRHLPRRVAVAALAMLTTAMLATGLLATGCGGNHAGTNHGDKPAASVPASVPASIPADAAFNAADVEFAAAMIPHHQQAVEMALMAETRATKAEVQQLAVTIRNAQDPEIATMTAWLREWNQPVPSPSGDHGTGHGMGHAGMPGMMSEQEMKELLASSGTAFDRMFLDMMIRHHQGAIDMAEKQQRDGKHPAAKQLAGKIAQDQAAEIAQMRQLLTTM